MVAERRYWMQYPHHEAIWAVKTALRQLISIGALRRPAPEWTEDALNYGQIVAAATNRRAPLTTHGRSNMLS